MNETPRRIARTEVAIRAAIGRPSVFAPADIRALWDTTDPAEYHRLRAILAAPTVSPMVARFQLAVRRWHAVVAPTADNVR